MSHPSRTPRLIALTGPPASGKSTFGSLLAKELSAVLLDQDTMTLPLVESVMAALGTDDIDSSAVRGLIRDQRYTALHDVAVDNLALGHDVVAVAPYTSERRDPASWANLTERAAGAGGRATLVWLDVPAENLLANLRSRQSPRDVVKLADPQGFLASLDLTPPTSEHVRLAWPLPSAREAARLLGS